MLLLELLLMLLPLFLLPLLWFEGVRAPPNPGRSFRRGGLRSGRDGRVVATAGKLGGYSMKKKLKNPYAGRISAASWRVSFRHRVCAARLAFSKIRMVEFCAAKNMKIKK